MAGPALSAAAPATPGARRDRDRERLVSQGCDALLVSYLPNVRYLSAFSGSSAALLLAASGEDVLLTDSRYEIQAAEEVDPAIEVDIVRDPLPESARRRLSESGAALVAFESTRVSVADWEEWRAAAGPELVGVKGWIEDLRAIKSDAELAAIRRAAGIADRALAEVLEALVPGATERQVAAELDHRLVVLGASAPAFDTIVAFGERSALPHAQPGDRRLGAGDLALFDFGARVDGYVCDVTRTVSCGEPDSRLRAAYQVVLAGQRAALEGLRAGLTGREADALARDRIEAAGHGPEFGHTLGHGIGLEVHEEPRLSRKNEGRLESGMVVTVEPGVYIQGLGGVRIEDDVAILDQGVEVLTRAPKDELLVL